MKCTKCRSENVAERPETVRYDESGLPDVWLVDIPVRRCQACGERSLVIPRIGQLHRLIANDISSQEGRLAPAEIRFLRKHLGFSGVDFAEILGVSPESVSRWENGHETMAVPTEKLLRLMVQRNEPIEDYPLDRLKDVAKERGKRTKLRLSPSSSGWRDAAAC
jgi:putative zinc finger/helix-turn-helix YgiT family protein